MQGDRCVRGCMLFCSAVRLPVRGLYAYPCCFQEIEFAQDPLYMFGLPMPCIPCLVTCGSTMYMQGPAASHRRVPV